MRPCIARLRAAVLLAASLAMSGCGTMSSLGNTFFGGSSSNANQPPPRLTGFIGGVAADEPNAALRGRDVLSLGGSAADAAVAMGFTLAVTLPSRASLGAGGACLAYDPSRNGPGGGMPEAIVFTSMAPPSGSPNSDRPAAMPMLARGLYALYARYGGKLPFEQLIAPAEQMARLGVPVSRAFANDLQAVSGPLLADPQARAVFGPNGTPLAEGQTMIQPALGGTLAQLRVAGVGDMYQGQLAQQLAQATALAGGAMTVADLRAALPRIGAPITLRAGNDSVAFLPPPADGGLAAAAGFAVLQRNPGALQQAAERALAVAARWRQTGGSPTALLTEQVPAGNLSPLPASTSFVAMDRNGNAVACAVSMNNLFGTGRIAPGTGILLAASPASVPMPLLAAAIAYNTNIHAFRAAVAGSGQEGAALAVADGMSNALRSSSPMPVPVPEPGRANAIACSQYLPGVERSCGWATDPRGSGLAVGSF
jgi:gamma-glutamyltranspeptidase / glutathione hydrolase